MLAAVAPRRRYRYGCSLFCSGACMGGLEPRAGSTTRGYGRLCGARPRPRRTTTFECPAANKCRGTPKCQLSAGMAWIEMRRREGDDGILRGVHWSHCCGIGDEGCMVLLAESGSLGGPSQWHSPFMLQHWVGCVGRWEHSVGAGRAGKGACLTGMWRRHARFRA